MKLTDNFYLEEFTHSQTASRRNINNTPSPATVQNLLKAAQGLEKVRTLLENNPITISSGYRSPELNKKVGGVSNSHHITGWAADFTCWSYGTPDQIVRAIAKSGIEYDQVIEEGSWVHISFKPSYRKEALLARFDTNGKATYKRYV